jgi:hypothetical protein
MARRKNPELRAVAYHEAGHAVLHVLAGQQVESVTIVPTKEYLGQTRLASSAQPVDGYRTLICLLAGPVAEALTTGCVNHEGATDDLEQIVGLVKPLLMRGWYQIDWVAQALLAKKSLTGDEVDALMRKSTLWKASQERAIAKITGRSKLF